MTRKLEFFKLWPSTSPAGSNLTQMAGNGRFWPEMAGKTKFLPPGQRPWRAAKSLRASRNPRDGDQTGQKEPAARKLPQGCASGRAFPIIEYCPERGRLAQLVRAPRSHRGGRRFKSSIAHHVAGTTEPGRCPDSLSRGGGTADALRSGRSILSDVWVQIPPSAPPVTSPAATIVRL